MLVPERCSSMPSRRAGYARILAFWAFPGEHCITPQFVLAHEAYRSPEDGPSICVHAVHTFCFSTSLRDFVCDDGTDSFNGWGGNYAL